MEKIKSAISTAIQDKQLQTSSAESMIAFLDQPDLETWMAESVVELVEGGHWTELNDRFYKSLSFGTGGMRGRTIGKVITQAEQGSQNSGDCPQHPAAGTNTLNNLNIARATQGLVNYLLKKFPGEEPKVVIAHDTRHFSREFAATAAETIAQNQGTAFLFEEERSTPELSFAVRRLRAHAGIVITASHNPPHDNGYKVYFQDGGQIVEPHASAIIQEVREVQPQTEKEKTGKVISIGEEIDSAYLTSLKNLVLEPELVMQKSDRVKIVYTSLHGTGIKIIPKILEQFGLKVSVQKEQAVPDGRFPTVKSPNPENHEALALALEQAEKEEADLVFGTDPDCDRMGVAVKNRKGGFEMLTGNQVGSIMAAYRLERMFALGILNRENAGRAVIIKTFVTTDLQKAIAEKYGVKCVETLTGFKYIGEKLKDYEQQAGGQTELLPEQWRERRLERSSFYVFGGEESYGYSGNDEVRDKDGNAAVLMCAEAAAVAASQNKNLLEYLDEIYLEHGFYWEKLGTFTFEGAEGAEKIKKLLQTYKENPPETYKGLKVEKIQDFSEEKFSDVDGKLIPPERMFMFHLETGFRIAVRPSGTEPKIKYYFFGRKDAKTKEELAQAKTSLKQFLEDLWTFTQQDVEARVAS